MDKQDQYYFDLFEDIKTEPEIGNSPTIQNKYCLGEPSTIKDEHSDVAGDNTTLTTFNDFEYETTDQFGLVEIKEEIIKCEMPKIEGRSDFPTKIDQVTVSENVQMFPKGIKQELEITSDDKETNIKQEISEYIQPKTESVVRELLTSECDLPTLKIESTDDYSVNYLGHTFSRKPLKNTSQVNLKKKRMLQCPICQNDFPSSISRSTHSDVHFEKRCAVCQFSGRFVKKNDFQDFFIHAVKNRMTLNRKKIDGVDDKSFKCDTCFKSFNQKYKLRRHLIMHSEEKPFMCDICSKRFGLNFELRRHLESHSSEKLFKCDICSKIFKRNCDLQRHLISHSGKPFKCDICSKIFSLNCELQRHLKCHSSEKPFKCGICFKAFSQNFILKQHLIFHSSERPFKCNVCFKDFKRKLQLQQHFMIHSGEKPFKCDICSRAFNRKDGLQRHLKSHSRTGKHFI